MKQSISELSILTGMDRRRIRKALADLPAEKGPKSALLYKSTEALPLLYMLPAAGDTLNLTQERALLAHYQAKKAEIELKALEGEFVDIQEVADEINRELANMRAKLLALPSKAAPCMVGLKEPADAFGILQTMIYQALDELHQDLVTRAKADAFTAKQKETENVR